MEASASFQDEQGEGSESFWFPHKHTLAHRGLSEERECMCHQWMFCVCLCVLLYLLYTSPNIVNFSNKVRTPWPQLNHPAIHLSICGYDNGFYIQFFNEVLESNDHKTMLDVFLCKC